MNFPEYREPTNAERAERGQIALKAYETYLERNDPGHIKDIITDLLHYCVRENLNPQLILGSALCNFTAEVKAGTVSADCKANLYAAYVILRRE